MNQSTLVVGALLGAFVIWLAVNNRLGTYYNVLVGPGTPAGGGGGGAAPVPSIDPASPNFNPLEWGRQFGCKLRQMFGGSC